jgi:PAS domain-containing protein
MVNGEPCQILCWMAMTGSPLRPLPRQVVDEIARGLIEAAPDAMIVIDDGGTIVLANLWTERMFGYAGDELIGAIR